jgi:hypothetical protein
MRTDIKDSDIVDFLIKLRNLDDANPFVRDDISINLQLPLTLWEIMTANGQNVLTHPSINQTSSES